MTDSDVAADARRAKVEALQQRRAGCTARAGAAQGSKIAAAGFGLTAMLGLVAAMGSASTTSASTPSVPIETVPPARVVVVIHPADGTAGSTASAGSPGVVAATPTRPIVLSAQPTVRQAPVSQAPAARTNGSR